MREIQVTIDCADPGALAPFWAEALGYRVQEPPGDFDSWDEALVAMGVPEERRNDASAVVDPDGAAPRLFFQRVPEGKQAKNRVHLDVRAAPGLDGEERMAHRWRGWPGNCRLQPPEPAPLNAALVLAGAVAVPSVVTPWRSSSSAGRRPKSTWAAASRAEERDHVRDKPLGRLRQPRIQRITAPGSRAPAIRPRRRPRAGRASRPSPHPPPCPRRSSRPGTRWHRRRATRCRR